jgi:hypothetical protein
VPWAGNLRPPGRLRGSGISGRRCRLFTCNFAIQWQDSVWDTHGWMPPFHVSVDVHTDMHAYELCLEGGFRGSFGES